MSESRYGPLTHTHFSGGATAAVANQVVTTTNMKVGAYTVANAGAMPTAGARHVTVTHTTVVTTDTLGTIVVVGTNMAGQTITETITPVADSLASGLLWFNTVTSVTGAGWVIAGSNDTLVVGCSATPVVIDSAGVLYAIVVNTTAAGAITVADAGGTIAVLKSNIVENTYYYECVVAGYLSIALAAASDVTVISSFPERV